MKRQMMIKIMNILDLCLPTIIQVCQIENQNNKIKSQCPQYGQAEMTDQTIKKYQYEEIFLLNKSRHTQGVFGNLLQFNPCYANANTCLIKIYRLLWNVRNLQDVFYTDNNIATGWTTNISAGYWYLIIIKYKFKRITKEMF